MNIRFKFIAVILCSSLCLLAACKKEEDLSNMKVPRLMIETRGVSYGNLSSDLVVLPLSRTKINLHQEPVVNEFEVINIDLVKVEMGMAILIYTTERGARALYRASVTNNGNRMVLMINGNPVGARRIDGAIQDGKFYTFVELPDDELEQFVLDVKDTITQLQAEK
ncbi:MAG TPA: hypothetical protein DCX06_01200 [Opitutae bacterium]|nr:hypothetical protein [Opitutae bacterium]